MKGGFQLKADSSNLPGVTRHHRGVCPIRKHFNSRRFSRISGSLEDGGVEGGADGGDVQTDRADGGVGVDEGEREVL